MVKKMYKKLTLILLLLVMAISVMPIKAEGETYYVWFDGTIGVKQLLEDATDITTYHPGMESYYAGATDVCVKVTDGKVTLPETAGDTYKYEYTLNGWYDVYNNRYYGKEYLGKEVEVTRDTVFYADWKATNYNLGTSSREKVNAVDTSNFITTDVFDYNELFNLRSAVNDTENDKTYLNEYYHAEVWELVDSGDSTINFSFLNWAYNDLTKYRTLGSLSNLNDRNISKSEITQGIISSKDNAIFNALFTKSDDLGRYYLGEGDNLYQYDDDSTSNYYGYYYYDSTKNGASYNQNDQKFYLYKNTELINEQKLQGYSWTNKGKQSSGFLPLNDNETGKYNEKDGEINYWFGMQSTIDFWLPNDVGTGGNKADTGKDMEFYFSGDDDVWVFVDDILVLDLGGIHGARSGSINFSSGLFTVENPKGTISESPISDEIKAGNHKLTVYYLERGSSQSNCSIYFNIAPKYGLSITKTDEADGTKLSGAKFGIYTDETCTTPALLWNDIEETGTATNEFVTNDNGVITCFGLVEGNTYYVKELEAPSGYVIKDSNPIKVTVEKNSEKMCYVTVTNKKEGSDPTPTPTITPTPTTSPTASPTASPTPTATSSTKKNTGGWDDGGPFTTDICGNVFDRWGNKIYEANACNVGGYNLVRTSAK